MVHAVSIVLAGSIVAIEMGGQKVFEVVDDDVADDEYRPSAVTCCFIA
jgi:hypothetical protein